MASTRRWTVSDGRAAVSLVLVILAVFLICAGTGAQSWLLAALGLALAAAGTGLYLVAALNSRQLAYVPGTANVQSCSPPPASASHGRCEMHLIVHAPGMDDVAVKIRDSGVPVAKWPHEGATLPILVALGDRRRVRVLWDDIRSHGEAAEDRPAGGYEEETEENGYLDGMLGGNGEDGVPDADPTTQVLEMEIFAADADDRDGDGPGNGDRLVPGDQESAGIDESPEVAESPTVEYAHAAQEAGAGAAGTAWIADSTAVAPARRRRPSPRPRRPVEEAPAGTAPPVVTPPAEIRDRSDAEPGTIATGHGVAQPTRPLRVDQVLTAEPAVAAIPSSSVVGDLAEEGAIAEAYLTITPPPGGSGPASGGRIRDVAVTLFVANLGRSVAFYRDLLGFIQIDIGRDSAVLESGDGRIVLRRVMDMPPVDRRLVHLMLEVPDVQAAYDELRGKGVEFVHRPRAVSRYEQLELWSAAFRDPDGHGIALIRWGLRR